MRQTHLAGEKLFVDWAGDAIAVFDPDHGRRAWCAYLRRGARRVELHLCGGALDRDAAGLDRRACERARRDRRRAEGRCVPTISRPASPSPRVTSRASTAPIRILADHYGFVVLPTRVRKPRDKAKVEVAVQIVERFVLAKLRNRRFFSLAELNAGSANALRRSTPR